MGVKAQVTIEVDVPEELWIHYLTRHVDIFQATYCGYWLRGVEHDTKLGWLCYESGRDDGCPNPDGPCPKLAARMWRSGKKLPSGYLRLNEDAAMRAYLEGVKRWGVDWFEGSSHSDANGYDTVIQLALLSEARYG